MTPTYDPLSILERQRYSRVRGMIAFVDESYRTATNQDYKAKKGQAVIYESPFYTLGAVVIDSKDLKWSRNELINDIKDLTEDTYWHTVEVYSDNSKRWMIEEMTERIAERIHPALITVQATVHPEDKSTLDIARNECIGAMAYNLGAFYNVQLMVMESRARVEPQADRNDIKALSRVMAEGILPQRFSMVHASPSDEKLLIMADILSWSFRRELAVGDKEYFGPLRASTKVIDTTSGKPVNESTPHMPQQNPGGQRTVGPEGGRLAVASPSSIHKQRDDTQQLHEVRVVAATQRPTPEQAVAVAAGAGDKQRLEAARQALAYKMAMKVDPPIPNPVQMVEPDSGCTARENLD